MLTMSPSWSRCSVEIRAPLTIVPLVEPRSTTAYPVPDAPDLGVAAADVVVGEGEVAVGQASDRERLVAQLDPLARREDEGAERRATRRLTELRRDAEAARFEGVLDP